MNNLLIQFKQANLRLEFNNPLLDLRLKIIIYALAGFINFNFLKALIVTEIFRTPEMQDEYYKDNPDYQKQKWKSVHEFWRGADISLKYFTPEEIEIIKNFLKQFKYDDSEKQTAVFHEVNVNLGYHLHLQVNSENITKISKT